MTTLPPVSALVMERVNIEYSRILLALPPGVKIVFVRTIGATHWSTLSKINTTVNGRPRSFFLKEYRDPNAEHMVKAEYESTTALCAAVPNNVPQPYAHGCFASDARRYFYLQSFCDMGDAPVSADAFMATSVDWFIEEFIGILAEVHSKESPTGKFGFHMTSA
jgi:protein-ribulosamine 3-kinase